MLRIYLTKRILIGFSLAAITLAWLTIYSYRSTREMISSSKWVAHTHDVLYHAEQVLAVACNIEIGQRGYALTGKAEFLEPYNKARVEIDDHYRELLRLTMDNRDQQAKLESLGGHLDELLMFSSSAIHARKDSFEKAQSLNASLQGKATLDKIRKLIAEFQGEEKRLLALRTAENENQIIKFNFGFVSLLLVSVIILGIVFMLSNANLKARIQSEEQVRKISLEIKDLYDNAPCGYHSLNTDGIFVDINTTLVKWLGYNDKSEILGKIGFADVLSDFDRPVFLENYPLLKETGTVRDIEFCFKRKDGSSLPVVLSSIAIYNENGEFIKSRSNTFDNTVRKKAEIKVQELNHELEAFTYSVSHDLRAPLRSIDGYARILKEDYLDKLDEEGKRVIGVIMNNAKRMGQLIDDLLDFARLGRKDVARQRIDMTKMVEAIAEELIQNESGRKIDVKITPLHNAPVDVDMIRQVWVNLLSNSIKYTGKNPNGTIEISSESKSGEIQYMVRDNGVGFDMQYVGKLFGVFQRLHKMQDFAGTGVGLAIVKRIIDRHDGRVWALGEINKGAEFYFTIPNLNG
jgi:PAS domain S-box-containing protein